MLVSHRHRFIYTKTLKTAGTSVESYFEPYCMPEGEWTMTHFRKEYSSASGIIGQRGPDSVSGAKWYNHMPARQIREQLGEPAWSTYYKFCVIRNPYEKMISYFFFARAKQLIEVKAAESDAQQFEAWLLSSKLPLDREAYVIDGKMCMDFIVRYEHLGEDLQAVCTRLGVPWEPGRLPTLKGGFRPKESQVEAMFTPRSEEMARRTYAFELENFGYSFGHSAPAPR